MDVDGDGEYSDDDLDLLPDDTFHRLQEHAITSTQQAPRVNNASHPSLGPPTKKASVPLAGDLNRLSVTEDSVLQDDLDFPHQPSSDYGDLDDDMLDGEIYDAAEEPGVNAIQASRAANISFNESTQRELWRKQRYSVPSHRDLDLPQVKAKPPISNGARSSQHESGEDGEHSVYNDDVGINRQSDLDALQAQILEVRTS